MRQFNDRDGRWRVWLISAEAAAHAAAEVSVSEEGWLCFESLETERRHRLPARNAPANWDEGADIHLRQLLITAKKSSDGAVRSRNVAKQRRQIEDTARGLTPTHP